MAAVNSKLARALGFFDLTLLLVIAVVNLNLVPVVASEGLSVLLLWLLGFLFFFLPEVVAVLELSMRIPDEGGIYLWSKAAYGEFHGFLSGWCYWTNNLFYVPTLFFYLAGFSAFIGGEKATHLADNQLYVVALSLIMLWTIVGLNVVGVGKGKWVQNLGAIGAFLTAAAIIGIAVIALSFHGFANSMTISNLVPKLSDWKTLSTLSVICFAFVGLELGSVMGDEIKNPLQTIPRSVITAGICCAFLYLLSTFALQATIPVKDIGVIQGILQAIQHVAALLRLSWILPPIAFLLSISIAGAASAWLSGSARLPFVIGLDRYLPQALGKVHERFQTPYVALLLQGIVSTLLIVINSVGSSVREEYRVLLDTAIIIQLIPFLYMFGALIKFQKSPNFTRPGYFKNPWPCYMAGVLGFVVTSLGILFTFVPSSSIKNIWSFEIKTTLETVAFIIPALLIYWRNTKRREIISAGTPAEEKIMINN